MRGRSLTVALALLAALPCGRALAQDSDYPNRIVTIVAPSAPGGLYSLFGRILGTRLEQRLGKSFVVENRPGASSVVGALAVARAPMSRCTGSCPTIRPRISSPSPWWRACPRCWW